jgi:hypothetical protein
MSDKAAYLALGLVIGGASGFLVALLLKNLLGTLSLPIKQYGVKYTYDDKGNLTGVIPVPLPSSV